jgi:hypothetical protein
MSSRVQNVNNMLSSLHKKRRFFSILPKNVRPYSWAILKWGIAGYLIRIIMLPLLAHRDLTTILWISTTLQKNQQLILSNNSLPIFSLQAFVYTIFSPILSKTTISGFVSNTSFFPPSFSSLYYLSQPGILPYVFVTKIPFLVFDFALALLLLHLIDDGMKATFAFKLWMMNPITIYVSYAMVQYDIIPTFFFILALYFYKKQKEGWTAASVGVSSAFKIFGLMLLPPIILISMKNHKGWMQKTKHLFFTLGISLLPLIIVQIIISSTRVYYEPANMAAIQFDINGFYGKTYYSRGVPTQTSFSTLFSFITDYSVGLKTLANFPDVIYLFPLIYGSFLLGIAYWREWSFGRVSKAFLVFFLAYYASNLFLPQWFIWVLPLLTILVAEDRGRFFIFYLLLIFLFFFYNLYWGSPVTSQLLIPIVHQAYSWPGPAELGVSNQVINVFRSVFSGTCIFLIALIFGTDRFLARSRNR